jgi:vitamin B12 transporter
VTILLAAAVLMLLLSSITLAQEPDAASTAADVSEAVERLMPDEEIVPEETVDEEIEEEDLGTAELVLEGSLRWTLGDTEALTTIPASEIAPGQSLADVLERVPGLDVRSSGGHGQLSVANLRGAHGEQVLVLIDGSPAAPGIAADLSALPLAAVESIEVLRGPQASRYGAGALGGVINLITRRPATQLPAAGSFYTPSVRDQITSAGEDTPVETPGLTTTAGTNGLFEVTVSATGADSVYNFSHLQADNDYRFERAGGATATRLNNESEQQQLWAQWRDGGLSHRLGLARMRRGVAGSGEFPTLQASLSRQNLWWQSAGSGWNADFAVSRTHFADPEPYLLEGAIENEDTRYRLSTSVGAYAGDRSIWGVRPRFDLIDSAEYGNHGRAGVDVTRFWDSRSGALSSQLELGVVASSDVGVDPVGRAGVGWDASSELHLYASAGLATRHPDFAELYLTGTGSVEGNPDLLPERVLSLEVGGSWHDSATRVDAALFASRFEESIIFAPLSAYLVRAINTGQSEVAGVELLFAQQLGNGASWKTAYTWLPVAQYESGVRLTRRARSHLNSTLTLPAGHWDAALELDVSSAVPADLFGNLWIEPRALLGLDLSRSIGASTLLLGVDNLLDESTRDSWNYPLPGREFSISWRTNL